MPTTWTCWQTQAPGGRNTSHHLDAQWLTSPLDQARDLDCPRATPTPTASKRPASHAHGLHAPGDHAHHQTAPRATPRATPSSWTFPELRTVGQSVVGPAHQSHAHLKATPRGHTSSLTVPARRPQPRAAPHPESQTLLRPHPFLLSWGRRGRGAHLRTAATACMPAAVATRGQSRPHCTRGAGEPARAHATGVLS